MVIKLNYSSLELLPLKVAIPKYERKAIKPGIVHIGVGNFHRAHQAIYLDRLFNLGLDHDWGVLGAGIMPGDEIMRQKLQSQDWLSTIVELDEKGLTARVCGAMIGFVDTTPSRLVNALMQPEIRMVSLTITEGGYFVDEKTGGVDFSHPDIQFDIDHPDTPKTVFGILIASLERRRLAGLQPFTVVSCDNLPHNGRMTQQVLVGLAHSIKPKLGEWIKEEVAFPNSMVDCITPATSEQEQSKLRDLFGIDDVAPVFCEPFRQWVIEDDFPQGRPAFEKVGVQFVDDVAPYELIKLRILNGGHAAIAFPAALLGFYYVHDAINSPVIRAYLEKIVIEEIIPTLQPVADIVFDDYFKLTMQRFSNPEVGDTISRLCRDSSNRLPKFIFPIIAVNIESDRPCPGLIMVVALWCLYCAAGADEQRSDVILVDVHSKRLKHQALLAQSDPVAFLEMDDVFGKLGKHSLFIRQFTQAFQEISQQGVSNALENYAKLEVVI